MDSENREVGSCIRRRETLYNQYQRTYVTLSAVEDRQAALSTVVSGEDLTVAATKFRQNMYTTWLLAAFFLTCIARGHLVIAQTGNLLPEQRIFQMLRTAWTLQDGAPQNINNLAETRDGTLWLGTRDGLYSFDGLSFTPFHPVTGALPRTDIDASFATREGDLWIAGGDLKATRIRNGGTEVFDRIDKGTYRSIKQFQQDSDGTVWAILNSKQLVRFGPDGVWHIASSPKSNTDFLGPLLIDSSDTTWVVADNLLYRRARGEGSFKSTDIPVYLCYRLVEGPDRSIWILGSPRARVRAGVRRPSDVGLKRADPFGKRLPNPITNDDVSDVVAAIDGSVWLSHVSGGLQRLRTNEFDIKPLRYKKDSQDLVGVNDGLLTTGYRALLRDHDGNIWVGGGRGLNRFKRATLVPVVKNAISGWWSFCVTPGGDVWVAVVDGYRAVLKGNDLLRLKDRVDTMALSCSRDSRIWALTSSGLAEVKGDQLDRLPLLTNHDPYWEHYQFSSIVPLSHNRLLASTIGSKETNLWILDKGTWRRFLPSAGIDNIYSMMKATNGSLYLGSVDGKIFELKADTYDLLSSGTPGIGRVVGFSQTTYGVIAFGLNGIAIQREGAFRMLTFSSPNIATSVTGVAEDRNHSIWLNGSHFIARIDASEILLSNSLPSHKIKAREFREGDFRGSDLVYYSRNSAQTGRDGRVWFATSNGVVYIDPDEVERPSHLPILSLRSIIADGKSLGLYRNFAPGIQTLIVSYFGLNLSNPTGVIYRYKLDGSDDDWQNVGSRTEAIYTHLRPGRYVFQVEASNGDGVWTQPLRSAPFTMLPSFYQTLWFKAFCILLGALLFWLWLNVRVRYVAAHIRQREEDRADERIRIAGEIHDTLLQGVQGLILNFHVAAQKLTADDESRKILDRTLIMAEQITVEGRNRLNDLRSHDMTDDELFQSLQRVCADLVVGTQTRCHVIRTGGTANLRSHLVDEIFNVGREALTNAVRHSGASNIELELAYLNRFFTLLCRDNGRGFDTAVAQRHAELGHWGLVGMAERVQRIGGRLVFESAPNVGTTLTIQIPGFVSYRRSPGLLGYLKRLR